MVYMLLGTLLFHGYLIFVRHGGGRLHAGDIAPLLKQGLGFFDEIRYVERDTDIDVEGAAALFTIVNLQPGLVRDRDSRTEAVKALRSRGLELREQLAGLRQGMQGIVAEAADFPGVPWLALQEMLGRLGWLEEPLSAFSNASKVSDLGNLDTSETFRETLKARLADLARLSSFLEDWRENGLGAGLRRMQGALQIMPQLEAVADPSGRAVVADLVRIAQDSQAIYMDERQLLRGDMRRPLKGKLEQFGKKYDQLYYALHCRLVGDDAPWGQLEALRKEPRFVALHQLKGLPFVSASEFSQIALQMQALERRRCRQFSAQVLESFVVCPYCRFPEDGAALAGLPARLDALAAELDALWERWQAQVFSELPGLADRLSLLSPSRRALMEELEKRGVLPDEISDDLLAALHELASDLQPIDLDLADLARALLAQGSALSVDSLRSALDAYLDDLMKGHRRDLVRINIVLTQAEEQ